MSDDIINKHYDGDVSMAGKASIGDNAHVAGNIVVGKNVKIKGWLSAKNIIDIIAYRGLSNYEVYVKAQEAAGNEPLSESAWLNSLNPYVNLIHITPDTDVAELPLDEDNNDFCFLADQGTYTGFNEDEDLEVTTAFGIIYYDADELKWAVKNAYITDTYPNEYSENLVTSAGVYAAIIAEATERSDADSVLQGQINTKASQSYVEGMIDTTFPQSPSDQKVPSTKLVKPLKDDVDELIGGAATLNLTPASYTFFNGDDQVKDLVATVSKTASKINIILHNPSIDTTLAIDSDIDELTKQTFQFNKTVQIEAVAIIRGVTKRVTRTYTGVDPIYCGFGASYSDVAVVANKITPATTTAKRTYTKTSESNNVNFYIIVPTTGVTLPESFTMGGAPFAMQAATSETIDDIGYKVYKSSAVYSSGTTLSVVAI